MKPKSVVQRRDVTQLEGTEEGDEKKAEMWPTDSFLTHSGTPGLNTTAGALACFQLSS